MHLLRNVYVQAACFFLLSFCICLPFLLQPLNAEPDAFARPVAAYENYKLNILFGFGETVWLPFHFTLLTLAFYIYPNLVVTPRVFTLLMASGSVALFYLLSHEVFGKKEHVATLISTLLFAFFPFHIFISTVPLSEPTFLFFILLSLYFLFREKKSYLWFLVFLNIAHLIRFESWLMLPLLAVVILYDHTISQTKRMMYVALSGATAVFWVAVNYFRTHVAGAFFLEKAEFAQRATANYFPTYMESISIWLKNMLLLIPPVLLIFSVLGVFYELKKKKDDSRVGFLAFLPYWLLTTLIIQVSWGTMEWYPPRYVYFSVVFLLFFVGKGIVKFAEAFAESLPLPKAPTLRVVFVLIVLCTFLINLFGYQNYKNKILFSKMHESAMYVQELLDKHEIPDDFTIKYFSNEEGRKRYFDAEMRYLFHSRVTVSHKSDLPSYIPGSQDLIIVEKDRNQRDSELFELFDTTYKYEILRNSSDLLYMRAIY